MKILYMAKRRYMRHDLIEDRYARLYELPMQLSCQGHTVMGICLSYKKSNSGEFLHHDCNKSPVHWHSFNAGPLFLGIVIYAYKLIKLARSFQPDVILASSDVLHIIMASALSRVTRTPYAADLYDNYEYFGMAKLPGLIPLYRKALRNANLISVVSHTLHDHIKALAPETPIIVLESTVDPEIFRAIGKHDARRHFGLDPNKPLIGTAGALHHNRGIQVLYDAFMICVQHLPDLHLILAGDIDPKNPPPNHPNVIHLGRIAHDEMPAFYNALDVAIICMIDTAFGRYAFPQKAYEIISCQTPVIATNIGALKLTLATCPQCLHDENNPGDLADKIISQLKHPKFPSVNVPSWETQGEKLDQAIRNHVDNNSNA